MPIHVICYLCQLQEQSLSERADRQARGQKGLTLQLVSCCYGYGGHRSMAQIYGDRIDYGVDVGLRIFIKNRY